MTSRGKEKYQHEVLFGGIFGALVLRSIFIFAGAVVGLNLNIPHIEVPTPVSLAVIFGFLALSMLLSFFATGFWTKQSEKLD